MLAPWHSRADESLARRLALAPLLPLAWGYGTGARLHRWCYERRVLSQRRLSCRVVSVGGLTAGGAGKTPVAAWLARRLAERGHRVALASRGHGRKSGESVTVVSDGEHMLASLAESGDEAMVLASHAPGVPVLVGPQRGIVGLRAVSAFATEVLILDDGFQHHALARDFELLIFDAASGLGNGKVLPRGPLREARSVVSRAHAIGVVDGDLSDADARFLARAAPDALRFRARRRPVSLRALRGGPRFSPHTLEGMQVGLLCGIGSPTGFRQTLEALGASVVAQRRFPDHHRYRRGDLRSLSKQAPVWVTTEKDAIKLRPEWARGGDVRVLRVELEVDDEGELLGALAPRLLASGVCERVERDAESFSAQLAEQRSA